MALGNTPRRETNISVEASKSYVLGLLFLQRSNQDRAEALDLTGATVRLVATDPPQRGSTEVINLEAVIDMPTTGMAQFRFQASDLSIEPGSYAYDVTMVSKNGYSTPLLKGYIEVGANTDLDDSNVYGDVNVTTDITVILDEHDSITLEFERVDGMFLVVSNLIEDFQAAMQAEVDAAAASAQASLAHSNMSKQHADEMRAWLDNVGFPFWKGTQAEYDAIAKKDEVLYLITDEVRYT